MFHQNKLLDILDNLTGPMDIVGFISELVLSRASSDSSGKSDPQKPTNTGGKPEEFETIDVDKPLWNQKTYLGRFRHFKFITDVRTVLVPKEKLFEAKKLVEDYKTGKTDSSVTRDDIIYAKKLRDSSFHPDNGELMNVIGRMSFQLPGNIFLTAGMLTFYKSKLAVVGWQLINQSFNAVVNFTNRNAKSDSEGDDHIIKEAYIGATVASCGAALTFKSLFANKGPVLARIVPFFAVAIGNMVNLPIMRQREIIRGIPISLEEAPDKSILDSKIAAIKGISECVLCRIAMAAPGMLCIPVITNRIKEYCFYQVRPWIGGPMEISILALTLLIMIPAALAIYPQRNSMDVNFLKLRKEEYDAFHENVNYKGVTRIYYNKGL